MNVILATGILFLKNRADILEVNKTNKNDVISKIGQPHSKSISNENEWIYIERILTKGEYFKLGQNILKENNVLNLEFDNYGNLTKKIFLDKNSKQKIEFSKEDKNLFNGNICTLCFCSWLLANYH